MKMKRLVAAIVVFSGVGVYTQAPGARLASSTGIPGLITATLVFSAADANKDGIVTRDELETAVGKWFASADAGNTGSVTRDQLLPALNNALPTQSLAAMLAPAGRGGQPQAPEPASAGDDGRAGRPRRRRSPRIRAR
jgi:hypothetical protein